MPDFRIVKLDDGRQWLTDLHVGVDCEAAIKMFALVSELASCECDASIRRGVLVLEDGTVHDLGALVNQARAHPKPT
jgi:hypothetical protein